MSIEHPQTVEEWAEYIRALSGKDLLDQAIAMNSLDFVEILQEDGFAPGDIRDVFSLFALQFREVGVAPPSGFEFEYLSFPDLLDELSVQV
jgi:hypothetical protein